MGAVRKVWWKDPAQWRKGQLGVAAAVGVLASQGLLEGEAETWTVGIVAAVGAFLTIVVPNQRPIVTDEPGSFRV